MSVAPTRRRTLIIQQPAATWTTIAISLCLGLGSGCSSGDGGKGGDGGSAGADDNAGVLGGVGTGETRGAGGSDANVTSGGTGGMIGSGGSDATGGAGGSSGSGTSGGASVGGSDSSGGTSAGGSDASGGAGTGGSTSGGTATGGSDASGGAGGGSASGGTSAGGSDASGGTTSVGTGGTGEAGAGGNGEAPLGPVLLGLEITGTEVPLMPVFDEDHTRYSVLASDPLEELTLTATAPLGMGIEVDGEAIESGKPVALPDAEPGGEIQVTVTDGVGDTRTYTVLYLPYNFARFRVTVREPGASTDPIYITPSETGSTYIVKLDNFGVPLYYRSIGGPCEDFKKHPNGLMSYGRNHSMGTDYYVLNESFQQIDKVNALEITRTDEHEFLILANGNYLLIGEERVTRDLSEYGGAVDGRPYDNAIQEITPDDQLVFNWNTWGRLAYDENISRTPEDYAHLNSVFEDEDGDLLVSSRHLAQVFKIDRDTGDIIWRLGGISGEFQFLDDPYGGLCGQHMASFLSNGNLLLFDNGNICYPDMPERDRATRVVEYELDETAMTARLVWSYTSASVRSSAQGSVQRLSNGNTFIGWGNNGDNPVMATEVDPEGKIVFQLEGRMMENERIRSYRALRFAD